MDNQTDEKSNDQLIIFDVEIIDQKKGQNVEEAGGFGNLLKKTSQIHIIENKIDVQKFQLQIIDFISKVQSILSNCKLNFKEFTMETVEVNAQISANGQIGFIGTHIGVNGSTGIKFIFKKVNN